jgi:hypothetical protein
MSENSLTLPRRDSTRRSWWAIAIGTVVMAISFASIVVAAVASQTEGGASAAPAFAIGFSTVPLVFGIAAFVSRHPDAPKATVKAMVVWLFVALPLSLFNPVTGIAAGFGAGGAVSLRMEEWSSLRRRILAALVTATYVTVVLLIFVPAGLFAGALLPLTSIGIADWLSKRGSDHPTP